MSIIRGISQTAGAYATDEPFVPLKTNAAVSANPADGTVNQIAQLQMGGYNDAGEMLTLRAAIADYSQWSTTPLDYTMNNFHLFDSGNELSGGNFTLAVLQQARNSGRLVQAGNHALRDPLYSPDDDVYGQLANDAVVKPGSVSNSFQTAAPIILADYPGWQGAVSQGVLLNAGNIELWDFPTNAGVPNGFLSFTPAQMQGLASILAAGSPPPTTGAPDDGSLLGFIAPAPVSGAPGRVAFSGTDAVLLASNSSATSYNVTLTSLGGGTLGIDGLGNFFGATSGTTLSLNGSLAVVNTVLAHLTDTVSSGTDVVHIVATDNNGNTIVRDVGVQTAAPVAPPAVTPGLLPANQLFSFTDGTARVVGQGQATNLDVAGQLGNSGILVGRRRAEPALARRRSRSQRQHVVAGGAVAQRLQHREPHDRRRLVGPDRQQHLLLGHARRQHDQQRRRHDQGQRHARRHGQHEHHQHRHDRGGGRHDAGLPAAGRLRRPHRPARRHGNAHHRCRRHAGPERHGQHADRQFRRQQQHPARATTPIRPAPWC